MFIPKENRIATFSYLFKEGVCVVKKDTRSQVRSISLRDVVMRVSRLNRTDFFLLHVCL